MRLAANKLTLNKTKPTNTAVKKDSPAKSLKFNIAENLNWESHINVIAKKIAAGICYQKY